MQVEKDLSTLAPQPTTLQRSAGWLFRMRRRIATGAAIVAAIFFGYHAVFGENGVNIYEQKVAEDHSLQKQIRGMQDENVRLSQHVQQLKSDPDAIEHEARARLHYARPGEVIWTLNDKRPGTGAPANAAAPGKK
jgi:cell division protein FtsB